MFFKTIKKCSSVQFDRFNYTDCNQNCPESCSNQKFTRNVEYVKYHEPIYRTIRKFVTATGSNDIDIAGFQISFPSMGVAVQRQRHDYTPSQFVSEIGGAAGLVLGASGIWK